MGLLTLLFALGDTISSTIREGHEERRAAEEKRRYEDINFDNIAYVTFDGTTQAYRTEIREEFDPELSYFLTQQDGWQHYELKEVEYEVEDGADYLFTIHFKDGSEIYRKFHESSPLTKRLLEYSNRPFAAVCEDSYVIEGDTLIIDGVGNTASLDDDPTQDCFAVIDFETTGVNYKNRFSQMDEILSVAIIDQDENVLLHTYCDTVNIKTWYEAQRVNGISPSDVKGYPTFAEILPKVIEILSSYDYVIAYNIPFEKGFLESYARRYTPTDFSVYTIKWGEDPMQLFMDHIGSNRYQKLITAASHFGYSYNAHDALADTKAALYVYKALRGM